MWTETKDKPCPECGEIGVQQVVITDEAWSEYLVAERHDCGWMKVYLPEHEWAVYEDTGRKSA